MRIKIANGIFVATSILVIVFGAILIVGMITSPTVGWGEKEIFNDSITGLVLATFVVGLLALKGAVTIRSSIMALENTEIPRMIEIKLRVSVIFSCILFAWAVVLLSVMVFSSIGSS